MAGNSMFNGVALSIRKFVLERRASFGWPPAQALEADDCRTFRPYAMVYRECFVLTAAARTPLLQPGRCGLEETTFKGKDSHIYRRDVP
jgi:hypothetical protein